MNNLDTSISSDEFGKEQMEFLQKIKNYENRNELHRYLLITSFGGIITLIGGFVEYIFYKFFSTDAVFFQFTLTNSPDPILLLSIWILNIFPLIIIFVFTKGTSGVINWNHTYKLIGYIAILFFIFSEFTIFVLGKTQLRIIPLIWGFYIFFGFIIAGFLMKRLEKEIFVEKLLFTLGILSLLNSFFSYLFLDQILAMFYMLSSFGIFLIILTSIIYLLDNKISII